MSKKPQCRITDSRLGDKIRDSNGKLWVITEIDGGYRWCNREEGRNKHVQKFTEGGDPLFTPKSAYAVKVLPRRPVLTKLDQHDTDRASERRIRELIVAAHTLTLIDHANTYPPVTVRVEDLQALLRLLDRARLNTKVRKL